jgi:hypothetical protein
MQISVKNNIKEVTKGLNDIQRKQIPFATARALTFTAKDGANYINKATTKFIDRPNPFTKRAFAFMKATKETLTSMVFAKDVQAEYLRHIVDGGTRNRQRGKPYPVSASKKLLDAYGNFGKGYSRIRSAKRKKNRFIANINGTEGLWERLPNNKLKLLAGFEQRNVSYRKSFPVYELLTRFVNREFIKKFTRSLESALRTAR